MQKPVYQNLFKPLNLNGIRLKNRITMAPLYLGYAAEDMNLPGLSLHPLKGSLKDFWSVSVSGNWRVIFRFKDGYVIDVDLDYH